MDELFNMNNKKEELKVTLGMMLWRDEYTQLPSRHVSS